MINWDNLLWVLIQFSVLSLVIERALYVLFEWKAYIKLDDVVKNLVGDWAAMKPLISGAVGIYAIFLLQVDMIAFIFEKDVSQAGMVITGLYVAGGSKAVFMMFKRLRELKDAKNDAQIVAHKNGNSK